MPAAARREDLREPRFGGRLREIDLVSPCFSPICAIELHVDGDDSGYAIVFFEKGNEIRP